MRVVEASFARNLATKPLGAYKLLVRARKLHLGNRESVVVTLELVNLEVVSLMLDDVTMLLDECSFGEL